MDNTHFTGSSGPVQFNGADRAGIVDIHQSITNRSFLIGQYTPGGNASKGLVVNTTLISWPYGKPKDGPREYSIINEVNRN